MIWPTVFESGFYKQFLKAAFESDFRRRFVHDGLIETVGQKQSVPTWSQMWDG